MLASILAAITPPRFDFDGLALLTGMTMPAFVAVVIALITDAGGGALTTAAGGNCAPDKISPTASSALPAISIQRWASSRVTSKPIATICSAIVRRSAVSRGTRSAGRE